ncbi:MAG: YfhO family protein [Bacillota bacterium]|nr:YfhO family protein [Bacillota bacterium]
MKNRIEEFFSGNKLIFAAFFVPVLLMLLAFMVKGIYPFGENQIAVIDMYHQYVPFLSELQFKLQEGGSLFYTWNGAGGSNFWNLLAYYGASPLNLLLALFPKSLIMEGVTLILLIKIGLAGSFMALYLRYAGGVCNMVTVAFSTLYALCSYVMAYYWCIMWIDAVTLLPLCILGLNRLMDDGRAALYTVSLALVVFINYYTAIMVCIFILCYYPVLYFIKVKKGGFRTCLTTTGKAVGYSLLAIVMAAVMLLPTFLSMQNAYYISSEMPDNWLFYNDALDVINQLLPNAELTYREGLPNLYCGLIVVMLLVFYILSKTIPLKEKALNLGFLVFLFLSLNINKLDFIWHGLHFPNQLPYRYTFVICFILVAMAYKAFLRIDEVKTNTIWAVLAAGIGYYLLAQKLVAKEIDDVNLFFYGGIVFLLLYCIVMLLYKKGRVKKNIFGCLIVVVILAEMASNTCTSMDKIGTTLRDEYFANSSDISRLAEQTREEFVRTEMDGNYILNCPALYHYRGISQFSSSLNASATAIMEKIGIEGEPGKNRYNYNRTDPVTNAILNVKYIISKNLEIDDPYFETVRTSGHTRLYENRYPLSIGYMTGNAIRTWDYHSENPFTVLDDYVRAATDNRYDRVFYDVEMQGITAANVQTTVEGDGLISGALEDEDKESKIVLEYRADETRQYYVFVEASNASAITVNKEREEEDIDIRDDCGSVVNIGVMEEGDEFQITVDYDEANMGDIRAHVCWMDEAAWDGAYEILSDSMMEVTDSGDTFIEGTVDVKEAGVLVTSVPYEEGWTLTVDGQEREIQELVGGAFISTALDEGTHEIRLEFRPPGILVGLALTLAAIALLIFFQVFRRRRRNRRETEVESFLSETDSEFEEQMQGEATVEPEAASDQPKSAGLEPEKQPQEEGIPEDLTPAPDADQLPQDGR